MKCVTVVIDDFQWMFIFYSRLEKRQFLEGWTIQLNDWKQEKGSSPEDVALQKLPLVNWKMTIGVEDPPLEDVYPPEV